MVLSFHPSFLMLLQPWFKQTGFILKTVSSRIVFNSNCPSVVSPEGAATTIHWLRIYKRIQICCVFTVLSQWKALCLVQLEFF